MISTGRALRGGCTHLFAFTARLLPIGERISIRDKVQSNLVFTDLTLKERQRKPTVLASGARQRKKY
ncbi:hypothetical protein NQ317_011526 [Molorchus minor]|uniref:Uncharacterized protein n=1 Tax=Molorchus minor TaxID=1323400 RepID=A0ABQ9K4N9_9CUCU|nr:hypothetical protein NQ317_011526 [Molorchus minor]